MSLALTGLSAGFILVLAFLFYLLIKTDLKLSYKFMAVLLSTGFYFVQYESLQQNAGWPSTQELPEKFMLIAAEIREPNQKTREPGVMYWWVRDSAKLDQPPRVYELTYHQQLHKESEQVISEQKKGSQYLGRRTTDRTTGTGPVVNFEKIRKSEQHHK